MDISVTRSNVTVTATDGTTTRRHDCRNLHLASLLVGKLRNNDALAQQWLAGANPPELDESALKPR